MTVHFCPELFYDEDCVAVEMRKIGRLRVLTSSIKFVTTEQLVGKRIMNIFGGIAGCIITGILFIFVAPAIYIVTGGTFL